VGNIVPKAAMYVRERIWSPDQVITPRKDGGITLTFPANSHIEVLNYGGEAVLRGPQDIKVELLKRLKMMGHSHR